MLSKKVCIASLSVLALCSCLNDDANLNFVPSSADNVVAGSGYVDLGLPSGTLWATANIGANAPEEVGSFFAWGETSPLEANAKQSSYKFFANGNYNKYVNSIVKIDVTDIYEKTSSTVNDTVVVGDPTPVYADKDYVIDENGNRTLVEGARPISYYVETKVVEREIVDSVRIETRRDTTILSSVGNDFYDDINSLQIDDDAAHAILGAGWTIPSSAQIAELYNNCVWSVEDCNGVKGFCVKGPNGRSIFLPFGGYTNNDGKLLGGISGYYWSSNLGSKGSLATAMVLYGSIKYPSHKPSDLARFYGLNIRPVYSAK